MRVQISLCNRCILIHEYSSAEALFIVNDAGIIFQEAACGIIQGDYFQAMPWGTSR